MLIGAAGDIHGARDRMHEDVLAFEAALAARFAWVLHVGDFGIWPDPDRIDKATRRHDGAGDFPAWFAARRAARRRTTFIKGNHEDFVWLDSQRNAEVLPGLFYLRNGSTMELDAGGENVRVGGVGGCYGPSDYERPSRQLQGYAKRHYTRDEIDTLCQAAPVDILLVHDAPAGVRFVQHRRRVDWVSPAGWPRRAGRRGAATRMFLRPLSPARRCRDWRRSLHRSQPGAQAREPCCGRDRTSHRPLGRRRRVAGTGRLSSLRARTELRAIHAKAATTPHPRPQGLRPPW